MRPGRGLREAGFQSPDQPSVGSVTEIVTLLADGVVTVIFGATLSTPIFVTEIGVAFPAVSRTVTLAGPVELLIKSRLYDMTSAPSFGFELGIISDQLEKEGIRCFNDIKNNGIEKTNQGK